MEQSLHHRIQERAYELWDSNGRIEGQAEQHWLSAERQVLAEIAPQPAVDAVIATPAREKKRAKAAKARFFQKKTANLDRANRADQPI
jgi:hypothetical protein